MNHSITKQIKNPKMKIALLSIKIRTKVFPKRLVFGIFDPKFKSTFFSVIIGSYIAI